MKVQYIVHKNTHTSNRLLGVMILLVGVKGVECFKGCVIGMWKDNLVTIKIDNFYSMTTW